MEIFLKRYSLVYKETYSCTFKNCAIKQTPKPDVRGNVFPKIVNTNFICGGMQSASDYYIDASGGRKASIINYSQVKVSG